MGSNFRGWYFVIGIQLEPWYVYIYMYNPLIQLFPWSNDPMPSTYEQLNKNHPMNSDIDGHSSWILRHLITKLDE